MVAWIVVVGMLGLTRVTCDRIVVMFYLLGVVATVCMLRRFDRLVRNRFGTDEQKAKYKKQDDCRDNAYD
jgi:hypothetical protein